MWPLVELWPFATTATTFHESHGRASDSNEHNALFNTIITSLQVTLDDGWWRSHRFVLSFQRLGGISTNLIERLRVISNRLRLKNLCNLNTFNTFYSVIYKSKEICFES